MYVSFIITLLRQRMGGHHCVKLVVFCVKWKIKDCHKGSFTPSERSIRLQPFLAVFHLFIEYCRKSSGSAIHIERNIQVEPEIHEMYIELLCKQAPPSVCTYLKMAEGYRLEETLEV